MHLYLDSANIAEIEQRLPHPLIHGVTTNPTLMKRAGLNYDQLPGFLDAMVALGAKAVHVQVRHQAADRMVGDARESAAHDADLEVIAKLPATREGFAAAARLRLEGIPVTMTAVYEPEQVLWSILIGARYAAPYLGRLGDAGRDGPAEIARMQGVLNRYVGPYDRLRLLVASVRTRSDVLALLDMGVGALTIRPELFDVLVDHQATLEAERSFLADANRDARLDAG